MKTFRRIKSITSSASLFAIGGAYVDTSDPYWIMIAIVIAIWATVEID